MHGKVTNLAMQQASVAVQHLGSQPQVLEPPGHEALHKDSNAGHRGLRHEHAPQDAAAARGRRNHVHRHVAMCGPLHLHKRQLLTAVQRLQVMPHSPGSNLREVTKEACHMSK